MHPHRIIINCDSCSKKKKRPVEILEVTFWIDEDSALYFIANCDCGQSAVFKTSVQELKANFSTTESFPIVNKSHYAM